MNTRLKLRNAERKLAKVTTERDALKAACHKNASKRHGNAVDWSDYQRRIDELTKQLAAAERRLTARDPQQRREMRRDQKRRVDDRAAVGAQIKLAQLAS